MEAVVCVFLIGVLFAMALPEVLSLNTEANRDHCTANIKEIQNVKCIWAVDHLGKGSPSSADDILAFQSYFTQGYQGVVDTCPVYPTYAYPDVSNIYIKTRCAKCDADYSSVHGGATPPL